ncbi:MAG: hypothetical protein HY443_00685 [Candidatus Nealsonbacteria bacterium]|nr:hypothetical protein [Candidatus Nealsonbacteria bacterium]
MATSRVAIHNILLQASNLADSEIKEKIECALRSLTASADWDGGFATGYYASWAEGLANRLQPETPLCKLLNSVIDLLQVKIVV